MRDLLTLENITLGFGGIRALSDVSLSVRQGGVTAVIGPNGAGKTSLFNVISGFYRASAGVARYDGRDLLALPSKARAGIGIARTFQNIALFQGLSVLENVKLGAHSELRTTLFGASIFLGSAARDEAALTRRIDEEILEPLDLSDIRDKPVAGLPYGQQKRIELARAMVMRPRLLMLDEPFAGMPTPEKRRMAEAIRGFATAREVTALLIDHDMEAVMGLSDHVVVLNFGKVIAAGDPQTVRRHPDVVEAYLGAA